MPTVNILSIPFSTMTLNETTSYLKQHIHSNNSFFHLITINPEIAMIAQKDGDFKAIVQNADMITPDGIGIVLASKRKDIQIRERVTGFELLQQLLSEANNEPISFYFLGTDEETNKAAVENIQKQYPNVIISGRHNGFFTMEEEETILNEMKEKKPDVVIVAMGAPFSDKWIHKHANYLSSTKLAFGVGGSLDVIAGKVKQTPVLWKKLNLEWLHRLLTAKAAKGQKSRWKRQFSTMPQFILKAIIQNK